MNRNLLLNITEMDKFRQSRRKASLKKQQPHRLENLSPDKYGKAAYNEMSYTPSRLAENILYKETMSLKKNQETSRKYRELEGEHKLLQEKFQKISKEKAGVEQTLNKQIQMYKGLLAQMEENNSRIMKDMQNKFKEDMEALIAQKQQEVKFAHAQKENLEDTIEQLQKIANQLDDKLSKTENALEKTTNQKQQLQKDLKNANDKIFATEEQVRINNEKAQQQFDILKDRIAATQKQWRDKKDQAVNKKNEEIKAIQKQLRGEIQQIHTQRENERKQKNDELKDLKTTFEQQSKRQNQKLNQKQKAIENLHKESSDAQERVLSLTQGYEQQITNLTHEKCKLFKELDALNEENTQLNIVLKDLQLSSTKQRTNFENYILKLKDDISINQVNLLRERDRNGMQFQGSSKEIIMLKKQLGVLRNENNKIQELAIENQSLLKEGRKLRQLLNESSFELEKCKDEFIKIGKERDLLLMRLQQTSHENNSLKIMKLEREDEARSWRDSYYINRANRRY